MFESGIKVLDFCTKVPNSLGLYNPFFIWISYDVVPHLNYSVYAMKLTALAKQRSNVTKMFKKVFKMRAQNGNNAFVFDRCAGINCRIYTL